MTELKKLERRITTLETIADLHNDSINDGNIIFEDLEKRVKLLEKFGGKKKLNKNGR